MNDKSAGLEVVASESGRFEYRAWHPHGPNVIDQTTGRWMSVSLVSEMASVLPGYVPDAAAIIASKDAEIERLTKECDDSRRTQAYWKDEHNEANKVVVQQAERIAELEKEISDVCASATYRRMQTTIAAQSSALAKAREALNNSDMCGPVSKLRIAEALAAIDALGQPEGEKGGAL